VEGQGLMPSIVGKEVQALPLTPEGDEALYLRYQDWIVREIATCFDISPRNMGLERDINRSTADAAAIRDWDQAIRPFANLIAAHLNRDLIQGLLGESQLEFRWIGLDRTDELAASQIWEIHYRTNLMTPNEMRHRLGLPRLENEWADLLSVQSQYALANGCINLPAPGIPDQV
jgi:capsid portal protein